MPLDPQKAAALAVLTHYVRWFDTNAADRQIIAEANARIVARQPEFEKMKAAFALFGYAVTTEDFLRMKAEVGDEAYFAAQRLGGRLSAGISPLPPTDPEKRPVHDTDLNALSSASPVREVAMKYLKSKGAAGAKAAEIRAFIEKMRGEALHEKTVGMTLYRLSLDGEARRDGRNWFFVSKEAKNPGATTPGLFNRDNQKGEGP